MKSCYKNVSKICYVIYVYFAKFPKKFQIVIFFQIQMNSEKSINLFTYVNAQYIIYSKVQDFCIFEKMYFFNLLNFENSLILQIEKFRIFDRFPNESIISIWKIFIIWNFWGWGLKFKRANMRIGEITSSPEYQMNEQFQNFPIFLVKFSFSQLKKISKSS